MSKSEKFNLTIEAITTLHEATLVALKAVVSHREVLEIAHNSKHIPLSAKNTTLAALRNTEHFYRANLEHLRHQFVVLREQKNKSNPKLEVTV